MTFSNNSGMLGDINSSIDKPKIKVLIIITKSNWGGAQKYVFDLATGLPKESYDIEVITGGEGLLVEKLKEHGIKTISIPELGRDVSPAKDIQVLFKLISIFKEKKPNVIQLNSTKIGGLGAVAGRIAGVKNIIFVAHGWAFNENRSSLSKILIKILYWVTIFLSNKTITVSNGMKSYIKGWPFIQNKIITIYNGINKEEYLPKMEARNTIEEVLMKDSRFLSNNTFRTSDLNKNTWIGTIAELHPIKNIDLAIRAMTEIKKKRKDVKYFVIGGGEKKDELDSLITELNLNDTVFLTGPIPNASKYLKAFDIFMLISRSEGLPYAVLEAGLAELPVIVTKVGGIPEIVTNMESGQIIKPNSVAKITNAIEYFLEHPEEEKKFAHALHKKVSDVFSIKNMVKDTCVQFPIDKS